jgi:hypothetical protein
MFVASTVDYEERVEIRDVIEVVPFFNGIFKVLEKTKDAFKIDLLAAPGKVYHGGGSAQAVRKQVFEVSEFDWNEHDLAKDIIVSENWVTLINDDQSIRPLYVRPNVNDLFVVYMGPPAPAPNYYTAQIDPATGDLTAYYNNTDMATLAHIFQDRINLLLTAFPLYPKFSITFDAVTHRFTVSHLGDIDFVLPFRTYTGLGRSIHRFLGFEDIDYGFDTPAGHTFTGNPVHRGYVQWTKLSRNQVKLFRPAPPNSIISVERYFQETR